MDNNLILSKTDHTCLAVDAKLSDIIKICDEGIKYNVASICIAPSFVKEAKKYVNNKIKVCTVIGFPNGYNTTKSKIFETVDALDNGCDEIDMVINITKLKCKEYKYIQDEISLIKKECHNKILKVIIETCMLSDDEKSNMCKIIAYSGANYIKTSTGFSKGGAKIEDIILFKEFLKDSNVKIKASGGINDLIFAQKLIDAGANRLGSSKIIKLIQNLKK